MLDRDPLITRSAIDAARARYDKNRVGHRGVSVAARSTSIALAARIDFQMSKVRDSGFEKQQANVRSDRIGKRNVVS